MRTVQLAVINEEACIGCAKCLDACPVDAIIGAAKQMHTVIAQECTGCRLCVQPCPVDCIIMQDTPVLLPAERQQRAKKTRLRVLARQQRSSALPVKPSVASNESTALLARKAVVAAAIARMQDLKRNRAGANTNNNCDRDDRVPKIELPTENL